MAGEVELGAETLGAALRRAVAEVEDDYDAVIELTLLGERPLDRPTEALAAAAREALRNAARHAPGAPIFVFAQASPDGAEVFVRDEGPGFDLAHGADRAPRRARLDHRPDGRGRRLARTWSRGPARARRSRCGSGSYEDRRRR